MNTQATLLFYCLISCIRQHSHVTSKSLSDCLGGAGKWACVTGGVGARRGLTGLYEGPKCQDIPMLFGKLVLASAHDISASRTSRIRPITSTQLNSGPTHSELNTNIADECFNFLKTSRIFLKGKSLNSPIALIRRNRKSSILEASTCISDPAEYIKSSMPGKENVIYKCNSGSRLNRPHDDLFPTSLDSNYRRPRVTEITIQFYTINKQTNAIFAAKEFDEVKIIIIAVLDTNEGNFIASSYAACVSVCWLPCVVTLLTKKTCRRRFCNPMAYNFEGHCYFLQKLQQQGKIVSNVDVLLETET